MNRKIPFYEQPLIIRRERLKNKNFSIICQNCIGGVIYHQLGLKFLSPTINLYFYPDDFLEFVQHLKFYLGDCPLVEDKTIRATFPVGILGDQNHHVRLFFNHAKTFDGAKKKWKSRRSRVNFNNLYIIAGDSYGEPYSKSTLRKFDQLPFKNKVILTGKEFPDIKSSYQIKNCNINGHLGQWFNQMNNVRGSEFFEQFDYVNFLNNK